MGETEQEPVKFVDAEAGSPEAYTFKAHLGDLGSFTLRELTDAERNSITEEWRKLLEDQELRPDGSPEDRQAELVARGPEKMRAFNEAVKAHNISALCRMLVAWSSERPITPENVALLPPATRAQLFAARDERENNSPLAATFPGHNVPGARHPVPGAPQ